MMMDLPMIWRCARGIWAVSPRKTRIFSMSVSVSERILRSRAS